MSQIQEKVKEIKRSFRLYMDGEASRSMREKGLGYALNWGVPLVRLRAMADSLPHDAELAEALWTDNVRECRILGLLLFPHQQVTLAEALAWGNRIDTQELAEISATYLFQHVAEARQLAFSWLQEDSPLLRLCAFLVVGRLLRRGWKPSDAEANTLQTSIHEALQSENTGLRRAATNCQMELEELA